MAQTSHELRTEIEQTREQMGDTVEALAHKADVPGRTKEWLGEKKDAVVSKVGGTAARVGDAAPDARDVKQSMTGLRRTAERNPLGLALAGAAAGFLAGVVLPSTRLEDERLGPVSDEMKSTAAEAGREALERGKVVAQETASTALDAAKESGREQGEELTASLQQQAENVRREVTSESSPPPTQ